MNKDEATLESALKLLGNLEAEIIRRVKADTFEDISRASPTRDHKL